MEKTGNNRSTFAKVHAKNRKALQKLVTDVYTNFDDSMVDRGGFRNFDTFFGSLPINIESSCQFLRCILKQPKADDFSYQLCIEKAVWNILISEDQHIVKLHHKYSDSHIEEEDVCFRIFCLFNRFCETDTFPMTLKNKMLGFLCMRFGVSTPWVIKHLMFNGSNS